MPMFRTRISLLHGGQVLQKRGGRWRRQTIFGWADLFGQGSIIAENLHRTNGPISIRILASWTCAAFQKTFITTIKAGGLTKMYCIFHRTGTGRAKKGSQLMYG